MVDVVVEGFGIGPEERDHRLLGGLAAPARHRARDSVERVAALDLVGGAGGNRDRRLRLGRLGWR